MDFRLDEARADLRAQARELAREVIAPRAAEVDRTEAYPWDNVTALRESGFGGWLVYEWDAAWLPDIEPAEETLPHAAAMLCGWATSSSADERVAVTTT